MARTVWMRLLLIAVCFPLVQCGEAGIAGKIEFEIIPKRPIVILSDFTLNPGTDLEKQIAGPWFSVTYRVTNNSDKTVTLQSLMFTVSAWTSSGGESTTEAGVDPADYESFFCGGAHEPTYLDEIGPGETVYAGGDNTSPCFLIYVGGLEEDVVSYSYQVNVSLQGWIGTATQPEDRLIKNVTFTTQ